ncbi:hypothetical protein RAS1_30690 [Phycisphaerae bacterium RAS1]|nr:hypothetical protein RAS1_30690 [Phycisphaerae bacterium RAS1]
MARRSANLTPMMIFIGALALRVAYVGWRWSCSGGDLEFDDEHLHWQIASNLVTDGSFATDDGRFAARMPLYPLFLAGFAWLGPGGILAARLAQTVIGAATAALAYGLARRALGRRAGVLAGVLIALDPFQVFFANMLLSEVLFALLGVALVYAAWAALDRRNQALSPAAIALALLGPAMIMTRPSAAGWIALLWIALCVADRFSWRAWLRFGMNVIALVLIMLPWGLRNAAVLGDPCWLSANGGVTLFDGQHALARGDSDQSFLDDMPELRGLSEVQRDQKLRELAIAQMKKDPRRVLELAWIKFRRTWNPLPNVAEYRGGAAAIASVGYTAPVLLGFLIGSWMQRRNRRWIVLIWLPVLYFTLLHCVYVGSVRYRVPLMPLVAIAAAGIVGHRGPRQTPLHRMP